MKSLEDMTINANEQAASARQRAEAIRAVRYVVEQLENAGFPPEFSIDPLGKVTLSVDLGWWCRPAGDKSAPTAKPAQDPAPHPVDTAVPDPGPAKPYTPGPRQAQPEPASPVLQKSGPLTDAERDRIVELTVAGKSCMEIAADLGRNTASIGRARGYLTDRIADARDLAKLEAPAEPKPEPEPQSAPAPKRPPTVSLDIPTSARDRAMNAHLNALGYSGRWTPCRDLALVETICRDGSTSLGTKPINGVVFSRQECLSRWRALNKKPGDLDHQAALLKVLRDRAAADADPLA